jgi:hypothetical protein
VLATSQACAQLILPSLRLPPRWRYRRRLFGYRHRPRLCRSRYAGRGLSTSAPLRALRARTPMPAWARRDVEMASSPDRATGFTSRAARALPFTGIGSASGRSLPIDTANQRAPALPTVGSHRPAAQHKSWNGKAGARPSRSAIDQPAAAPVADRSLSALHPPVNDLRPRYERSLFLISLYLIYIFL